MLKYNSLFRFATLSLLVLATLLTTTVAFAQGETSNTAVIERWLDRFAEMVANLETQEKAQSLAASQFEQPAAANFEAVIEQASDLLQNTFANLETQVNADTQTIQSPFERSPFFRELFTENAPVLNAVTRVLTTALARVENQPFNWPLLSELNINS
jgi:hypothetical protein